MKTSPWLYVVGGLIFSTVAVVLVVPAFSPHFQLNGLDFLISLPPGIATAVITSWRLNRKPQDKKLLRICVFAGMSTAILTYLVGFYITMVVAVMNVGFALAVMMLEFWSPTSTEG